MMYYLGSFEIIDLSLCHEIRSFPKIINSLHLARSPFSTIQTWNDFQYVLGSREILDRQWLSQGMVVTNIDVTRNELRIQYIFVWRWNKTKIEFWVKVK